MKRVLPQITVRRVVVFGLHRPDAKTGRQLFVTAFQAFDIFIVTSHKVFMAKHRSRWVFHSGISFYSVPFGLFQSSWNALPVRKRSSSPHRFRFRFEKSGLPVFRVTAGQHRHVSSAACRAVSSNALSSKFAFCENFRLDA